MRTVWTSQVSTAKFMEFNHNCVCVCVRTYRKRSSGAESGALQHKKISIPTRCTQLCLSHHRHRHNHHNLQLVFPHSLIILILCPICFCLAISSDVATKKNLIKPCAKVKILFWSYLATQCFHISTKIKIFSFFSLIFCLHTRTHTDTKQQ